MAQVDETVVSGHERDSDPHRRYVAYYRVSTQRQGRSGLGLEALREMVRLHALAIRKARGAKQGGIVRLDFRTYFVGGNAVSNTARRERALARAKDLSLLICDLRDAGRSVHGIAVELTRRRIEPPGRGRKWYPAAVRAAFALLGEAPPPPQPFGRGGQRG